MMIGWFSGMRVPSSSVYAPFTVGCTDTVRVLASYAYLKTAKAMFNKLFYCKALRQFFRPGCVPGTKTALIVFSRRTIGQVYNQMLIPRSCGAWPHPLLGRPSLRNSPT